MSGAKEHTQLSPENRSEGSSNPIHGGITHVGKEGRGSGWRRKIFHQIRAFVLPGQREDCKLRYVSLPSMSKNSGCYHVTSIFIIWCRVATIRLCST